MFEKGRALLVVRPRSGRLKIAQHFSAGTRASISSRAREAGERIFVSTGPFEFLPSVSRTSYSFSLRIPPMNRWAIFFRPLRGLLLHANLHRSARRGRL